jgi:hypothetical protein
VAISKIIFHLFNIIITAFVACDIYLKIHYNEEFYLLGYNAVEYVENQLTFRRKNLQSRRLCQARNQREAGSKQSSEMSVDFQKTL